MNFNDLLTIIMLYGDRNLGLLVGYHDLFWYCLIKTQFLDETITVNPYVI